MRYLRITGSVLFLAVVMFLSLSFASAEPVLIKLSLEKPVDWTNAASLGVTAYYRWDDFVLAEFEWSKLGELDRVGLEYQIVDENPWSEGYFLVSSREGVAKVNLRLYGRVLLEDPQWQLIKTSKERASELRSMRYDVVPIHHTPIPLKYKPPSMVSQPSIKYSTSIDSLLNLVSIDSLYAWDLRLQNFKTRYAYIDSIYRARDWLYNKFVSFGISNVWLHYYNYDSDQWNVVATVTGTTMPDKVIVVGGHYDSVVYGDGTNPYTWAPGADDNASGTVLTLEMARIIAQHPLPFTVMFVPFDQEEQGLVGSYFFAWYLYNQGTNVQLMVDGDMIGHSVDSDPDVAVYGDASAMSYINVMIDMANTYTYLRPYYGGSSYSSDQHSFAQFGYDAICAGEGDFHYAGWHTNYDVVDSLDFDYMKQVVKMCLASIVTVANAPSIVESLKVVNAGDGHTVYLNWLPNPPGENVAYYQVYFGTTSGHYDSVHQVNASADTLRGLKEDSTYYISVTATNNGGYESGKCPEVLVEVLATPMDRGLLVVDETYQGSSYNMVNGDSINAFYNRALQDYTFAYVDHSCPNCSPQNQLHVKDLVNYTAVIVHSEDNRGNRSLGATDDSTYYALKKYLSYGGKVIIEGRRNLSNGNDGESAIRVFSPGEIPYDYLEVRSAYVPVWTPGDRSEEFIGASNQVAGYPSLQVDSLRVAQCSGGLSLLGRVPGVGYIDSLMAGEIIYNFHSTYYDTSHSEGKPVAFRYLGDDYKVIYFDFPLYFIQEPQATELLQKALGDLGISKFMCGDCNASSEVELGDVVYLINYLYKNGAPPMPMQSGDVNLDSVVELGDIVYLINYLYKNGNPPCRP